MSPEIDPREGWSHASIRAVVTHVEKGQRIQRDELGLLRRRFEMALDDPAVRAVPLHTLDILLACLEKTSETHAEASAHLFSHLMAQERGGAAAELQPFALARLLRALRADHEVMLGLIEFARRSTANFVVGDGSTRDAERLYEALNAWVRREEDRIRFESTCLVPRALALNPGLGHDVRPVTLVVNEREILSEGGHRRRLSVFCPAERRSVDLEWCHGCPLVLGVDPHAVRCTPDAEPEDTAQEAACPGVGACVGEVMGRRHMSVLPDVSAGDVLRALNDDPATAVLLVDDGDRLLGLIDPAAAASAAPGTAAGEMARATASIAESTPLSRAVEQMVRAHARFLPVVREDGRVVGVLADLDALRWVALHRARDPRDDASR